MNNELSYTCTRLVFCRRKIIRRSFQANISSQRIYLQHRIRSRALTSRVHKIMKRQQTSHMYRAPTTQLPSQWRFRDWRRTTGPCCLVLFNRSTVYNISQGSVATRLSCGGRIFSDDFYVLLSDLILP